jgi:type I restriction enzyme, S subunit
MISLPANGELTRGPKSKPTQPSSEMSDTGIPWIGFAPKYWPVKRLRWTFESARNGIWGAEPDGENDIPCVRVADFDRVAFRVSEDVPTIRGVTPSERRGRVLNNGDLLLEKSGGGELQPVGAVAIYDSARPAVCSNFLSRLIPALDCNSRFLSYLHAHLYYARVNIRSIKQTTGIQNLDAYSYFCEQVPVPPFDEQQSIAAFLDRETVRIDRLIAENRRLIELLDENRAAVITQAVTKGLNPKIPTKESGIDWLGTIPCHWSLKKLKHVSHLQTGLTLGKKYDKQTRDCLVRRPYLRVANVQDGWLDLDEITEVEVPPDAISRYELQAGDVLMTEGGDYDKLGRGYVWEGQIPGCLHQNHIFAVRPNKNLLNSRLLSSLMSSHHGRNYFTKTSQQTTNLASTNSTKLGEFPVPLPPIDEQLVMIKYILNRSSRFDALSRDVATAIDRLREYRSALITAAVTGQIDVRNHRSEVPCQ